MMDELVGLLSPAEKLELEKKVESYSNWKAEKRRKTLEENICWDGDAGAYADGCYDWDDDLKEVEELLKTHE